MLGGFYSNRFLNSRFLHVGVYCKRGGSRIFLKGWRGGGGGRGFATLRNGVADW